MIATRSANSETTPRSWVIRRTAIPCCSRISLRRERIWAWMVTSSAVVGSSAMRRAGSRASAIAILAPRPIPPPHRCGEPRAPPRPPPPPPGPPGGLRLPAGTVGGENLGDLVPDRENRVERRHRLLEDHGDLLPPPLAHPPVRGG